MKDYQISGSFRRKGRNHKFNKVISGKDKEHAVDKLLATLGSIHGAPRRHITVDNVMENDKKE